MMNIRIESDGTPKGTIVTDENGCKFTTVAKIEWSIDATERCARAIIEFLHVPVHVKGGLLYESHADHNRIEMARNNLSRIN